MADEKRCNAELHIGDDYGDNQATMRCALLPGHSGNHWENWRNGEAQVEWSFDDRERTCEWCDYRGIPIGDWPKVCAKCQRAEPSCNCADFPHAVECQYSAFVAHQIARGKDPKDYE